MSTVATTEATEAAPPVLRYPQVPPLEPAGGDAPERAASQEPAVDQGAPAARPRARPRRARRAAVGGRWTPRTREWALLALIVLAGAVFRFTGVNWDSGHHLHPDERFLTMVETSIRPGVVQRAAPDGAPQILPASLLATYFDTARSGLNPNNLGHGFYVYGTLPLFVVRFLAEVFAANAYDRVHLFGRVLSAISDLVTVALIYLVGRRLYDARIGLLAAALTAFCVLHIQHAHFFVMDSFLVTLVVASFYWCVDIAQTGRRRSFLLAGLSLGLALATKLSMLVFVPIVALAAAIYVWRSGLAPRGPRAAALVNLWASGTLARAIAGGALAAGAALLAFRIFQPYAFAGPGFFNLRLNPRWVEQMAQQARLQDGTAEVPFTIQWAGTEPLLFPWRHMVAWGMGLPLGLAAWAGFAAAVAVVLWKGRWQHLLVVSWAALCFVYFSSLMLKTMRYLLPAYPFFILLGAWGLVALYDLTRRWASRRAETRSSSVTSALARFAPPAALAGLAFVVVASAAWSFAFTRIYTRPVTRLAASAWIYEHVPKGAAIANEHWDDSVPVPLPGRDPGTYRGLQLPMYDADDARKLDLLVQTLAQADYINLTSNRLYGSIPRIPERYPLSTVYYRALFAGELGFELVQAFTSYPTLGPWVINDDRAEEAFTVYDHPKVLIFQKQPGFSPERVRQILGAVPLDDVVHLTAAQVGRPNLMLPPDLRQANTAGGTWSTMFDPAGAENRLAPLVWWLTLQALGLLAAPLVWLLLARLPDRGYGLSKPLGLLAVAWLAWSLAGYRVLPWTRLTLLLAVLALAAASALVLRRRGTAWLAWLRGHRRLVLATEGVFLAAFVLFTLLRLANPDLWHPARGGEKPMEFSYLNAVIRTTYFPPYDPWFAGGYLNYYYFGYVLVAALTKLTGVIPSIAFNVAIPALYALTAAGCFSFAYNLARLGGRPGFGLKAALGAGAAGFLLVAFVGNLDGFAQLLERLARLGHVGVRSALPGLAGAASLLAGVPAVLFGGRALEPFDFWRSSRVIPNNTINEFPFWTFLFADLHAHLISIPYQVAALGVLLNVAYGGLRSSAGVHGPGDQPLVPWLWRLVGWRRVAEIVLLAWLAGALYVINSWEFPTYLLLAAGAFLIAEFAAQRGLTIGGLARAAVSAAAVFVLAKPLFRPFWSYFVSFYNAVAPWTGERSRLDHYLIIHGLFVFLLATFVALCGAATWRHTGWWRYLAARWRWSGAWARFGQLERALGVERRSPAAGYLVLLNAALLLALAALLRGLPLIAFLVVLLCALAAAAWERRDSPALLLAALLAGTGCALSIFVEFFTLQGDIGRMNTVFKFYLQIWVMWGLVAAAALAWAVERLLSPRAVPAGAPAGAPPPRFGRPLLLESPAATGYGDGAPLDWPSHSPKSEVRSPKPEVGEGTVDFGLRTSDFRPAWWQWAWLGAGAGLVLAALAFPLGGTPARLADRFTPLPPTLDGMAYMKHTSIVDGSNEVRPQAGGAATIRAAADYDAIQWLLANVQGTPVVLEASVPEYRWGARVAKYTGLPAVLGWRWHQAQQRGAYAPLVDQRLRDVQTMFNDPSPSRVTPFLSKYQVRYIYVGDLERAYYSAAGLAKFGQMPDLLRPVYDQAGVTIYEVIR